MTNIFKMLIALSTLSILTACPGPTNTTDPSATPSPQASGSTTDPGNGTSPTSAPTNAPTTAPTVMPTAMPSTSATNPPISTLPVLADGYRLSINGTVFNGAGNRILNERLESTTSTMGYMRLASTGFEKVGDSAHDYDFRLTIRPSNNLSLPATFIQSDFASAELELNMTDKKTGIVYSYSSSSLTGTNKAIPADAMNNSGAVGQVSNVVFSTNSDKTRYSGYVDTVVSAKSGSAPMQNLRTRLEFNYLLVQKTNR